MSSLSLMARAPRAGAALLVIVSVLTGRRLSILHMNLFPPSLPGNKPQVANLFPPDWEDNMQRVCECVFACQERGSSKLTAGASVASTLWSLSKRTGAITCTLLTV